MYCSLGFIFQIRMLPLGKYWQNFHFWVKYSFNFFDLNQTSVRILNGSIYYIKQYIISLYL